MSKKKKVEPVANGPKMLTPEERKTVCVHLRDIMYYRLKAWDASVKAEEIMDEDIDADSNEVDFHIAGFDDAESVRTLADDAVFEMFFPKDEEE